MTTVGFTRPSDRLEAGRDICRKLGMSCLCAPSLDPVHGSPETFATVASVLKNGEADYTIFASASAIEECIREFGKDTLAKYLEDTLVACTGEGTAKTLRKLLGRDCDYVPEVYTAESLALGLKDRVSGLKVLLLRSDVGENVNSTILTDAGAQVVDAAVYGLSAVPVGPMHIELMDGIASGKVNAMTFSSPRSAKLFYDQMYDRFGEEKTAEYMTEIFKVAIGVPTKRSMEKLGMQVDALPEKSTFEGMLQLVADRFADTDQ